MAESTPAIRTLDELRAFVHQTVCAGQQLLPNAVRVSEQILVKHGKPCGLQFTLNGPRQVQFLAIWDAAGQTILFYESDGGRFQKCEVVATAELEAELATLACQSD